MELNKYIEHNSPAFGNFSSLDLQIPNVPTGSLFTYQFSGCFFDYEKYEDEDGTNYFENTKKACYDNYYFCKNNKDYLTFKNGLWGISASDGPHGYKGYGIPPYDYDHNIIYTADYVDGTIAIYSLINSIPYIGNKVSKIYYSYF